MKHRSALLLLRAVLGLLTVAAAARGPLPSWNDGPAKQAILNFVKTTTEASSPNFVPPQDRIATFDQDGTTWIEHPMYTQLLFAFDRVHELAPKHPEWKTTFRRRGQPLRPNGFCRRRAA